MTPEQLAEIRARAEAATPGPWEVRGEGSMAFVQAARTERDAAYDIEVLGDDDVNYPTRGTDLQFVAHARTDIPALLDYIEELQAVLWRAAGVYFELYDAAIRASERAKYAALVEAVKVYVDTFRTKAFEDMWDALAALQSKEGTN